MPKAPPPEPPPPPECKTVQVHCVPWKSMDFQVEAQFAYLSVAELEDMIKARHGDAIENLVLYKDAPFVPENQLASASSDKLDRCGSKVYYDYYPPMDPFRNRPTAQEVYTTNPLLKTKCTEEYEGKAPDGVWKNTTPVEVTPSILPWSKTAEHDPHTARILAAEAAAEAERVAKAEAEAARIKAEEEARLQAIRDEKAAKKKAKKEAEKAERERIKAEKEAEEQAAREAEEKRLAEEAAARGEEPPAPKPAMPTGPIPPRVKGMTIPVFLGPTSKTYFGLDVCTKDQPWTVVKAELILAEIKDKGKISDMYVHKDKIEGYKGEDGEILFCLDRDEVYSDEGFVMCVHEAEKINFQASIAQGNGLPPPM